MLIRFLEQVDSNDKQGRQFAQQLIRKWFDRAMAHSDVLLMEILNRIEGQLAPVKADERKEEGPTTIVMDMPAPPLRFPPLIPVTPEYAAYWQAN